MHEQPFPVIDLEATGKNILRLRQAKGLTVRDMQGYFRFEEPRAIYKWQSGQSLPTVDNLLALSQLLEVRMEEILVSKPTSVTFGSREESRDSVFCGDVILYIYIYISMLRLLISFSAFVPIFLLQCVLKEKSFKLTMSIPSNHQVSPNTRKRRW